MGGGSTSYSFMQPGSASNILANVINSQYQNYLAQFVPQENKLISFATDPNAPTASAQQAMATAGNAFQAQQQGLNKQLKSQGIVLTPDQKAALGRQQAVAKTTSMDDAANRAAISTYNLQNMALTGSPTAPALPAGAIGGAQA
jgi:hypothetical protein